jgi:hypothetical protein
MILSTLPKIYFELDSLLPIDPKKLALSGCRLRRRGFRCAQTSTPRRLAAAKLCTSWRHAPPTRIRPN